MENDRNSGPRQWQYFIDQHIIEFIRLLKGWVVGGVLEPDEALFRCIDRLEILLREGTWCIHVIPAQQEENWHLE